MTEQSRHIGSPCRDSRHRIAALTDAEQLLVWALRSWAFAHQASRSIERDLIRICGRADGEKAAVAIRSILVLVALYGRRGLRLAPPGWPAVTVDEFRLLQLFAAAQRGMGEAVEAHLAWMLRPGHAANPEVVVEFVARTLRCHGVLLPWRQEEGTPAPPLPVSRTPVSPAARLRVCE